NGSSRPEHQSGAATRTRQSRGPGPEAHPSSQARGESAAAVTAMKPSRFSSSRFARVGTGALACPRRDSRPRLSGRAQLGSCPCPRQPWIRHAALCSADVLRVAVNDAIQPVTAEYIGRALAAAAANHDQAVLIEINTPGGLVD